MSRSRRRCIGLAVLATGAAACSDPLEMTCEDFGDGVQGSTTCSLNLRVR